MSHLMQIIICSELNDFALIPDVFAESCKKEAAKCEESRGLHHEVILREHQYKDGEDIKFSHACATSKRTSDLS